jgi:hypothetical protein
VMRTMFELKLLVPLLLTSGVLTAAVEIIRIFLGRKRGNIDSAAALATSALGVSSAYSGQVDFLEKRLITANEEINLLSIKLRRANTKIDEQEDRLRSMAREIDELRERAE